MKYTEAAKKHLDILCARYHEMLPSEIDLNGDIYRAEREERFKRVYRNIDAPNGRTNYWDQPLIEFAMSLGGKYKSFADEVTKDFLEKSKLPSNMLLWGNHYYYSDKKQCIVTFVGTEEPYPCPKGEKGELHELRPVFPCFDELFEVDACFTEKYICQLLKMHLVDKDTGEFNRHADGKRGYAFMESGGILAKIACLLYKRNGDITLIEYAKRVADFSYSFKNSETGLIENCPTQDRWDKYHATTETFHWTDSLLDCYKLTGDSRFLQLAVTAADSYIKHGTDTVKGKIYGCINVKSGAPFTSTDKETIYMPDAYANPWQGFFPTHDYIFSMASVCLRLFAIYNTEQYLTTALLIANQIKQEYQRPAFAEHYGSSVGLFVTLYTLTKKSEYLTTAKQIADYSINRLQSGAIFKGHPDKNSCGAVDGLGYLFKSYAELDKAEAVR